MVVLSKITAGLLSVKVTGKIADKLIFEKWKNKQTVKRYAKPKNPKTSKQQKQRGYMAPVVEAWHKDGYTPEDKEAWNNYARIIKVNATGYNMFTRFKINAQKDLNTWEKLTNCQVSGIFGTGCKVKIDVPGDKIGILFYGKSKVALFNQVAGVFSSGHNTFTIINLKELTRYYFYIQNTSPGEVARTGIYTFKTTTGGEYGWFVAGWFSTNDWFYDGVPIVPGWFIAGWFDVGDWFSDGVPVPIGWFVAGWFDPQDWFSN